MDGDELVYFLAAIYNYLKLLQFAWQLLIAK